MGPSFLNSSNCFALVRYAIWGTGALVYPRGKPELSAREREVRQQLRAALDPRGKNTDPAGAIRAIAAKSPDEFFPAAISTLESKTDPQARRRLYVRLMACPEFLGGIVRPGRYERARLVEICAFLMTIGDFDIRLARLIPGRDEDASGLDPETVVHILDLLNEISPAPRLILVLSHLATHPDERVASKATLLIGRRLRNPDWVASQLDCDDARVRASVTEGLWGVATPASRATLLSCLQDENNRVVGNAIVGLHLTGDARAAGLAKEMLGDERAEFRATAAWVMAKIGGASLERQFADVLREALEDPDASVREAAHHALEHRPAPVEPAARRKQRFVSSKL
jgi:HEAT repeats